MIPVEVRRPSCAPDDDSWLATPAITYTPWSVTITLHTSDAFGDTTKCGSCDDTGECITAFYLSGSTSRST